MLVGSRHFIGVHAHQRGPGMPQSAAGLHSWPHGREGGSLGFAATGRQAEGKTLQPARETKVARHTGRCRSGEQLMCQVHWHRVFPVAALPVMVHLWKAGWLCARRVLYPPGRWPARWLGSVTGSQLRARGATPHCTPSCVQAPLWLPSHATGKRFDSSASHESIGQDKVKRLAFWSKSNRTQPLVLQPTAPAACRPRMCGLSAQGRPGTGARDPQQRAAPSSPPSAQTPARRPDRRCTASR